MASTRTHDCSPLPVSVFHILLALGDEELHGYAIMRRVEELTDGAVTMGPGTLYGAVKRMLADGLIEETAERPDPELDDQRRRYYRVTALGARACAPRRWRVSRRCSRTHDCEKRDARADAGLSRAAVALPAAVPARVRARR